jgi:hypothetical protein
MTNINIEEISIKELNELRSREMEEDFDFEEIKKYLKLNKKLTNV